MVVGVGENGSAFLQKVAHQISPPPEVVVALLLETRVPSGEFPPVTEPADVGEVRRRLVHPGHPRVVDERQGGAALSKHLGEVGAQPAPVPHLHGIAETLGQPLQEIFEDAHPLDGEGRRELEQERSQPVAEFGHRAYKTFGVGSGADQVLFVRDLLRKLGGEQETFWHDLAPVLNGGAARGAVEGRVYLHGRIPLHVLGEPRSGRKRRGIEGPLPVRVRPAGGSEVEALFRRLYAAGGLREEPLLRRIVHLPSKLRCYHRGQQGFMKALPVCSRRMYYISAMEDGRQTT